MSEPEQKKSDERRFLHDLAGPIGTALFLSDIVLESLRTKLETNSDEISQLQDIYDALKKTRTLMQERRSVLIAREGSDA